MRLQPKSLTGAEIAERVEATLETRKLTLYQASQKSAAIYGHASPYFLPHNLYYDLKLSSSAPSAQASISYSLSAGSLITA